MLLRIVLLLTFTTVHGLNCDKSKWTCSDYAYNFEKESENTLKCLEYDYRLNPLEVLGTPPEDQIEIEMGINTRKIKLLNTASMVISRIHNSLNKTR